MPIGNGMRESAASNVWPATTWATQTPSEDYFEAIRGLLYNLAVSLVFVWAPIGFIIYGMTLIAGPQ